MRKLRKNVAGSLELRVQLTVTVCPADALGRVDRERAVVHFTKRWTKRKERNMKKEIGRAHV